MEKAKKYYQLAIEHGQQAGYDGLIRLYHKQERYDDVFQLAKSLSDSDSKNKRMHLNVALYYLYGSDEVRNCYLAKQYLLRAVSAGEFYAVSFLFQLYAGSGQEIITLDEIAHVIESSPLKNNRDDLDEVKLLFFQSNEEELKVQKSQYRSVQLSIYSIFVNESVTTAEKIESLLALAVSHDFDEINISSWVLTVSKLFLKLKYSSDTLREKVIVGFGKLVCQEGRLFYFSVSGILSIWRSLRYLGVSLQHSQLKPVINFLFRQMIITLGKTNENDCLKILASMTKLLPCNADEFLSNYEVYLKGVLDKYDLLSESELPLLLQCVSIAHFSNLIQIDQSKLGGLLSRICLAAPNLLDIRHIQQALLGLRYFLIQNKPGLPIEASVLKNLEEKLNVSVQYQHDLKIIQKVLDSFFVQIWKFYIGIIVCHKSMMCAL